MRHIDQSVMQLISDEKEKRRDPAGVALGLALLATGGFLSFIGYYAESWRWAWITAAVASILIGAYGVATDSRSVARDDRGNPIESSK